MIKKPAFTLIEILVTSTIIIILMGIGMVSFREAGQSARNARRKADMETIRQAQVLKRSAHGCYVNTAAGTACTGSATTDMAIVANRLATFLGGPFPTNPSGTAYTGSSSISAFCFCAVMEGSRGNSNVTNCSAFVADGTGANYCVRQP